MRTVLVVDDEPQVREIAAALFESFGCRVLVAANATEALRTIETYPGIALLFTDITMPGMSGWELAREVRKAGYRDRPILIAISGQFTKAADRLLSESVGFQYFFTKPCPASVLLKVLAPLAASCR